jgi:DNA-binding NtrC family response regulator
MAPGLVVVFDGGSPTLRAHSLTREVTRIGRGAPCDLLIDDVSASRVHAEVSVSPGGVVIRDLGSRNGTYVDGERVHGTLEYASPRVMRIGGTVMFFTSDVSAYEDAHVRVENGVVLGLAMQRAYERLKAAGDDGRTCLISGESGTGKEHCAHRYYASRGMGEMVIVNCAAIPKDLAEAAFFGAKKGSHSGAAFDVEGHFEAADRGVLFLDEVGTLDLAIQAKLLRAVETKHFTPVGSTKSRLVNVAVCAATNADLEDDVARGTFRMDLYQRLKLTSVAVPPLRERPEEIGYLVEMATSRVAGAKATGALVEECLLRAWRDTNARGLFSAVENAARAARGEGRDQVLAADLDKRARSDAWPDQAVAPAVPPPVTEVLSDKERKAKALVEAYGELGNVDRAAEKAGVGRTTAYAILNERGIKPRK